MSTIRRCEACNEPVEGPDRPADCPMAADPNCALWIVDEEGEGGEDAPAVDPFGQTMLFEGNVGSGGRCDGFPDIEDLEGTELGQYAMGPEIGRGSMARVYRAEHKGLGRPCAIKVIDPGLLAREPHLIDLFWAEARAAAGLVHPHIVTIHNLGSDRGYHFIEMELVPGATSLTEQVLRHGALPPQRATSLVRDIARALEAAHSKGMVHRDVKPANVLMSGDGLAKLADFGLVRDLSAADRVASGRLAGTPTFMAPELFRGEPANPRTDLYAVGVTYFFLLTGHLPFTAERLPRLIKLHQREPVPDPRSLVPDVPAEAAEIARRLLAKDPGERHGSAAELCEELRGLLGHLRDTESLVLEALEGLGGVVQQGGRDRFRVILPVPSDRIQEVYIDVMTGRHGERLLSVYSVCAPADPAHYEYALKLNGELTHGSLSIHEVHGRPMFVMSRTFSRAHVNPEQIREAVLEISRRGDHVERDLTDTDLF